MVETKNKGQRTRDGIFGKWPACADRKMPARRSLGVGGENGNFLQSRAGFTFIELLIAIGIIGVLSTLFIATYPATQRRARDAERRSDIKQYQTTMEAYANSHDGNYPVATEIGDEDGQLCKILGTPVCPNDPQSSYKVISSSAQYTLWATLEQPKSTTTYYIVCSNGRSYESTSEPTAADPCP